MSKIAIIPTETAVIPIEEARKPLSDNDVAPNNPQRDRSQRQIKFCSNSKICDSQSSQSSVYKETLSQPHGLSHRERLLWLQGRRTEGLWAQCDSCDRWRYLPQVIDRYELPDKWYCKMNPDKNLSSCSAPEIPINLHDEEDLIHNRFSAGSVVLVKMADWPWWPAMVDDCPDTEQFYWLDGFSDIPTHYHVVFFDKKDVTRAWVSDNVIVPYTNNEKKVEDALQNEKYAKRLRAAVRQASDAVTLPLASRFAKYSFLARYKGDILSPARVSKTEVEKYRKIFKRKFDVDLSSSDTDGSSTEDEPKHEDTGTGNKRKAKVTEAKKMLKQTEEKPEAVKRADNSASITITSQSQDNDTLKENNSLKVHVNSTQDTGLASASMDNCQFNNDRTENINSKATVEESNTQLEVRLASSGSDEFEF